MQRAVLYSGIVTIAACFVHTSAGAATVSVNCASAKIQPRIDAAPAATPTTITLTGACVENLTVPYGKDITLVGSTGSSLAPKVSTTSMIINEGRLELSKMNIAAPNSTAPTLIESSMARTAISATTIKAPKVEEVVFGSANSVIRISNSSITGGTVSTVDVGTGSIAYISGDPGAEVGTPGAVSTLTGANTTGSALRCTTTGSFRIRAFSATSGDGSVRILGSKIGIDAYGCTGEIQNKTALVDNISVSSHAYLGISASNSRLNINGARVASNKVAGIGMIASNLILIASKLTGNPTDIHAQYNSQVLFQSGNTQNTLPELLKTPFDSLYCKANSEISIPKANLKEAIGTEYDFLGCVKLY